MTVKSIPFLLRSLVLIASATLTLAVPAAFAHRSGEHGADIPAAPAPSAAVESLAGTVSAVVIDDRAGQMIARTVVLRLDDGKALVMVGSGLEALGDGMRIEAMGRRNGDALFAEGWRVTGSVGYAGAAVQATGTLGILHSDDFDSGTGEFFFVVEGDDGSHTPLALVGRPTALTSGMRVSVSGHLARDGASIQPTRITLLEPRAKAKAAAVVAPAAVTNNLLVIHLKYRDTSGNPVADPFPTSTTQTTVFGASNSVIKYYNEVSYGQQLMTGTVTPWLVGPGVPPATCNYTQIETDARNAATAAGYVLGGYQNVVYTFSGVNCGWSGLGYVGFGRAWINGNQGLLAYVHELGHNFGLYHAASLDCGAEIIGGTCSVSEYGDPFDVMGNIRSMHFNAMQKADLGWIGAATVKTHPKGTTTYSVNPLETGGGSTYAVKIVAKANRTYWLEYRQPVGFDSALSSYPNNGAQVRVSYPFEWVCSGCGNDTQILDMTPATSTFNDAALVVGQQFVDAGQGIAVNVTNATPAALTLAVTSLGDVPKPDLDFSGSTDLIWQNVNGSVAAWLMSGTTATASATIYGGTGWTPTHTGDFNGDGKGDLLWRNGTTGQSLIWLMNGLSMSAWGMLALTPTQQVTHVGDFNGDGRTDLIVRDNATGVTSMWLMSGTSPTSQATILLDPNWAAILVADFDGDGKSDIVWRNASTGQTSIWLMNGASILSSSVIFTSTQWAPVTTADFNGDGKADLVWRNNVTGQTALWLMNGTAMTSFSVPLSDPNWRVTQTPDTNGDGKSDIVWHNSVTGQTALWLTNGLTATSFAVVLADPAFTVQFAGDMNGDGKDDLVWRSTSGTTALWLMNGLAPSSTAILLSDPAWGALALQRP